VPPLCDVSSDWEVVVVWETHPTTANAISKTRESFFIGLSRVPC